MQALSPNERTMIGAGSRQCFGYAHLVAKTEMPRPMFNRACNGRVFADTVTDREFWPA